MTTVALALIAGLGMNAACEQAAARPWRFDLDVSQSRLSNDAADWRERSLTLARRFDRSTLAVRAEAVERYGREELYGEARWDHVGRAGVETYVALGGAGDAVFRPEAAVRWGLAAPVSPRSRAAVDVSLADYASGVSQSLAFGFAHDVNAHSVFNIRIIAVEAPTSESGVGAAMSGNWRLRDSAILRITFADAPEFDGVKLERVQASALDLTWDSGERAVWRAGLLVEERRSFARTALSFGIARRF
jgi:YaiO family outer membrane protein